jgi:hypothetical protein
MVSALDIDSKVESFNSIMTDVLDRYAPLKMVTYYESSIASVDVELRLLIERGVGQAVFARCVFLFARSV